VIECGTCVVSLLVSYMLLNVNVINIRVTCREVALVTVNCSQPSIWTSNSCKLSAKDDGPNVLTWQLVWVSTMKDSRFCLPDIMPVAVQSNDILTLIQQLCESDANTIICVVTANK